MIESREPNGDVLVERDSASETAGTLASLAYRRIREDVLSGGLQAGARLRMQDLRQRYEIGLAPLREALSRLRAEGMVSGEDHRGYWVAPLSMDELMDLTRIRMLLEGEALRESIAKGDDRWEGNLLASCHRLTRVTERGGEHDPTILGEWEARHEAFHEALIAAAGSRLLLRLRAQLSRLVHRYRIYALLNPGERDVQAEHLAIMKAALERDGSRATTLLAEHYDLTTRIIVANFGDRLE